VPGEKAGPMANAAAQGDGRPQPVRGGKRAGGRPDVTAVPVLAGCAGSGPAGRVEAEPWIRHPCPCLRLRPPAGPVAPGRGLGVGVHHVAGVDRPGPHCTVIVLRGRQRDQLARRFAVSAPDHSDQSVTSAASLPVVHSRPESQKVVRPGGSQRGSQRLRARPTGSPAVDRPLMRPGINRVGADCASVPRCRRSLPLAVGRCCCCHR